MSDLLRALERDWTREEFLAAFRLDLIALGVHPVSLAVFERQVRADERERAKAAA